MASWTASSARPSPSAPTALNPATAAAVGARRGLAGSQRVSLPVAGDTEDGGPGGDHDRDGDELEAGPQAGGQSGLMPGRGEADAEVAGRRRGDPQQADQRAGDQQGDRDPARLAGGDLGPEAVGNLGGMAELADGRPGGLSRRQPRGPVRVGRVQEPGAQLGHDAGPGPGGAGQLRGDLGEIVLDRPGSGWWRARPGHGELAAGAGCRRAVTAAEKSCQVLRSVFSARRPAGVS